MSTMKEAQVSEAVVLHTEQPVGAALPPADIKAPVTAAQAKVEAVANLTMQAYEKASTLKLTPEEIASLQADFPDSAFQPGASGKEHLIYIEHAHLRDRLNQVFGPGQWAIIPRNRWAEPFTTSRGTEGSRVYVEAMLVIRGAFVSEAVGAMEYYPKNESQNYGDAVEGAKTAALRRCAKELGIGLQAWKKEWCEQWWARKRGGRDFSKERNAPGRSTASTTLRQPEKPPITQPAKPKEAKRPPPPPADDQTRARMIAKLEKSGLTDLATEYFRKLDNPTVLLDTENLEHLPLEWVPITTAQVWLLESHIKDFGNGAQAEHPYKPNPRPEAGKPAPPPAAKTGEAKPKPHVETAKAKDPEWWRDVICPVPPRGMKRDEYMKHPQTVGEMYEGRHDPEINRRLFGFVMNFTVSKTWIAGDGSTRMRPQTQVDADTLFREALDACKEYGDKHDGDTEHHVAKEEGQSALAEEESAAPPGGWQGAAHTQGKDTPNDLPEGPEQEEDSDVPF